MSATFSAYQLRSMIAAAKQLGFTDDVEHWEAELKQLEGN